MIFVHIFLLLASLYHLGSRLPDKPKFTIPMLFSLLTIITYIVGIIYSFISSADDYTTYIIMLIGGAFMMIELFSYDHIESRNKKNIQRNGIKTAGILTKITPTGTYHSTASHARELILEFDYMKKDGSTATGKLKEFVEAAIESRLNKGMVLPVIYYDEDPGILVFEKDLDYDLLEEGDAMSGRSKQSSF